MDLENTLQEISLKQTINDTIQVILPLVLDKDIQIHQNINTDMILSVNLNLWNKALSNIIGNAVRHSPCGENVFITLRSFENRNALVIEKKRLMVSLATMQRIQKVIGEQALISNIYQLHLG